MTLPFRFRGFFERTIADRYRPEEAEAARFAPEQSDTPLPQWQRAAKWAQLVFLAAVLIATQIIPQLALAAWVGFSATHFAYFALVFHNNPGRASFPFHDFDEMPFVRYMPRFWLSVRRHLIIAAAFPILDIVGPYLQGLGNIQPSAGFLTIWLAFVGPFFVWTMFWTASRVSIIRIDDHPTALAMFTWEPRSIREGRDAFQKEWRKRWEMKPRDDAAAPSRNPDETP
jgi:hypothetical protein